MESSDHPEALEMDSGPYGSLDIFEETMEIRSQKRKRPTSMVSSFINPKVKQRGLACSRLSSGSFSSLSNECPIDTTNSLYKFQELLKNPPSPTSPVRGSSLVMEINAGVAESVGKRQRMEDRHKVVLLSKTKSEEELEREYLDQYPHAFFGVYDGHGGTEVAEYVAEHLHNAVVENILADSKCDVVAALQKGFSHIEAEITDKVLNEKWDGLTGSTVCVALMDGHNLYVANVGDSGAILCRNGRYMKLSYPHTPTNEVEKERVLKAGGILRNDRLCHPVWNPGLINVGVTRSIGDVYYKHNQFVNEKRSGLIAEPEIATVVITTSDEFLLLASDGFWDVMNPCETLDYVKKQNAQGKDPTTVCQELTNLALKKATTDDVTVLLVNLQQSGEMSP